MEIVGTIVCFSAIGAFVAFVFVMMLINSDPKLTTFLELMIGIGGSLSELNGV